MQARSGSKIHQWTPRPPLGWNSYDAYGCAASEETLLANLEAMAERLRSFGYEYFVVDNGWFGEYDIPPGRRYPLVKHAADVRLDEFGRYQPSQCYFPNGLQPLIDRTHALGLKFGLHVMRGISRKAVALNLPIYGTPYRAADIADPTDTCKWCAYNYGVDMSRPGAQSFYDSWIGQLAEWGVDFIKADDITGFPREIEAMALAIERSGRPIVLSLSPGGQTTVERMGVYTKANMVRTTTDIWDNRNDLNKAFAAWEAYNEVKLDGFWLDLDMLPFGHLQLWNPQENREKAPRDENMELSGKGFERMSGLTREQQLTFLTIRALAASPLFMGGDLPTSDEFSLRIITNRDMLACNQNGVMGRLTYREEGIDVWVTPAKGHPEHGWLGVFNRTTAPRRVGLSPDQLGLVSEAGSQAAFRSIWPDPAVNVDDGVIRAELPPDGVLFLAYSRKENLITETQRIGE